MSDDDLPHFAAPPDPDALVHAVDQLVSQFRDVADGLRDLTTAYQRDRRFRRGVTAALVLVTLAGFVVAGVAISTALRVQDTQRADQAESCLRGNALRLDLYAGVDAVLDTIAPPPTTKGAR